MIELAALSDKCTVSNGLCFSEEVPVVSNWSSKRRAFIFNYEQDSLQRTMPVIDFTMLSTDAALQLSTEGQALLDVRESTEQERAAMERLLKSAYDSWLAKLSHSVALIERTDDYAT